MTEPLESGPTRPPSPVHRLEDFILTLLVGLLVILSCTQILLRNFLEITYFWIEPLTRLLVLWSSFLGALVATRESQHVRIDAVLRWLPGAWRHRATMAGDLVAAGVCGFLSVIAARFVRDERSYGGTGLLDMPQWSLQMVFPIIFLGMALRFAITAWRRHRLSRRQEV